VHHSYHEANFCANVLASHGCLMDNTMGFYEYCPALFNHLLFADVMMISTPRLVHV
jgi:hypothetical protein